MADNSQISRSRWAVLAVSGIAAAYGIYTIYNIFSDPPAKTALRRSNAVHRPRPPRRRSLRSLNLFGDLIDYNSPDQGAPLGTLCIRNPGQTNVLEYNLSEGRYPTEGDLDSFVGSSSREADYQHELRLKALECIFWAALLPDESRRQSLAQLGLEDLPVALAARDRDALRQLAGRVNAILPISITATDMDEACSRILSTDADMAREIMEDDVEVMTHVETAPAESRDELAEAQDEPTQGLKGLLYHIAESNAKRKAYLHRGIHCEDCGERPIRGIRWHCLNCPDYDLCSTCEAHTTHPRTHVFAKIVIPLPRVSQPTQEVPLWYPGDPTKVHDPLNADLKKRLGNTYNFDGPHMDAHYDQFCCIANIPWRNDPNGVMAGIDRRAFNKALTSERWPQRFRPNALYDRMFAFYDTNQDGIIGFEEFVSGLAYLRGPQRFGSLKRALEGFDINGDGYVCRADFLRLFRAKYEIQQLIIGDMVEAMEKEHSRAAMEVLRSSQPISSVFNNDEIPPGEMRVPEGKRPNEFRDMVPLPETSTILSDDEKWSRERSKVIRVSGGNDYQGLQGHLSRFEELLSSPSDRADDAEYHDVPNGGRMQQISGPVAMPAHTNGTDLRAEQVVDAEADEDDDDDPPLDQDVLWEVIEDGFNELLDGLFKAKEDWDQEVVKTRRERERWRSEIDEVVREKETLEDSLKSASDVDPLMATAFESFANANGHTESSGGSRGISGLDLRAAMVPTDTASLERHEEEIAGQSLDELLDMSGYAVFEGDSSNSQERLLVNETYAPTRIEEVQDPTMPQNRPNSSILHSPTAEVVTPDENVSRVDTRPTRERLEVLSRFDELDREIRARGDLGVMSFAEIEELAQADRTKELRGLITGWLDLASF